MTLTQTEKSSLAPDSTRQQIEEELAELRQKAAEQESLLASNDRQRQALQQQLNLLHNSLSWRLTVPIRKIGNWLCRRTGIVVAAKQSAGTVGVEDYQKWLNLYDTLTEADRAAIGGQLDKLVVQPLISILLPVVNPPEHQLLRSIASVRAQLYPHWELCIAEVATSSAHLHSLLLECQQQDARIRVVVRPETGGMAVATNSALELASGEFVALLDAGDELAPHALFMLAIELNRMPGADILYTDEDSIDDDGRRSRPQFKSAWNPDLFFSWNYLSHLTVFRAALIKEIGGCRREAEGSHEYDLALRCLRRTKGERIRHIPAVLYHRRRFSDASHVSAPEISPPTDATRKVLADYFAAEGLVVSVEAGVLPTVCAVKYRLPEPAPLVSLIMPTRDGGKVLRNCLESIHKNTTYPQYEILVVDNQSQDAATLNYLASLADSGVIRLLHYDKPFNYSAINNFAVSHARGDIVGLLNDDLEVISPDWLTEMVRHALRPEIGAVGAKLYYPDRRIQHAGVILGLRGVAGHAGHGLRPDQVDCAERLQMVQNYSAVTAACMVVRKSLYVQVGGLDELNLPVAYNDVDFCLRLVAAGYRNLWTPLAELYHHESVSRGYDETTEKRERWQREFRYMQQQWGSIIDNDPCYNANLSLDWPDFRLACPPRVNRPWETN